MAEVPNEVATKDLGVDTTVEVIPINLADGEFVILPRCRVSEVGKYAAIINKGLTVSYGVESKVSVSCNKAVPEHEGLATSGILATCSVK